MNICLLGDCKSGKSSFSNSINNKEYNKPDKTIGVDYNLVYIYEIDWKIWELSGDKKFNAITRNYYKQKDIFIIFFDINNIVSFKNIQYWIDQIISNTGYDNNKILLIGNKIDLERKFDIIDLNMICNKYGINYVEVSIKRNINIDMCLDEIYRLAHKGGINSNNGIVIPTNKTTSDNYIRLEDTDDHIEYKGCLYWLKSLCCFAKT